MKKNLFSISAFCMLITILSSFGCGSNGSNNLGTLALLSGGNSISGSSENIIAASAAISGVDSVLSVAEAQSTESSGGSMSIAKDYIKEQVIPDIKGRVMDRMAATTGSTCDGSIQPINKQFTSPFSEDGLYVEPNLTVTGTSQCISNSDGSTTTNWVLNISGSVATTFTDKKVCSFDIEDFVKNKNFNFVEHTLNGQVTIESIQENHNMSIAWKYESTSDSTTTTMTMSQSGNSSCHAVSSNLSVDSSPSMSLDLTVTGNMNWDVSSSVTYNNTLGTYSLGEASYEGSESHYITGTVNGEEVSIRYGFNADDYKKYNDAFRNASCCTAYGTMAYTIDGAAINHNMCMANESSSGTSIIATTNGNTGEQMEMIFIYIGDGSLGDHNNSSFADYEYICYYTMLESTLFTYYGTSNYSGSSTIYIDVNNDTVIEGTFSGTVCDTNATPICKTITEGTFTARKSLL